MTTKIYRNPETLCPNCQTTLSASSLAGGTEAAPIAGDFSICGGCALPLIFRGMLIPCKLSEEEIDACSEAETKEMTRLIQQVKSELKKRTREDFFTPKEAWDIFVRDALVGVPLAFIPDLKKSFYSGLLSLLPIIISIQKDFPPAEHSQIYDRIFISVGKELGIKISRKLAQERGNENDRRH